ncbi:MAG TPA: prolipoprotein diacylglyceryl transferase family protein, partial [Phycisphaerae bacterium]
MHPDLWTLPGVGWTLRSYGVFMAIGFLLAIWIAGRRARRAGLEPGTIITLALIGGPLGYFGARAMHV